MHAASEVFTLVDELVRTHVMLPKTLVEAVDRLVRPRGRSAFVARAVEEQLAHEQLGRALEMTAGFLTKDAYPE